MNGSTRFSSRAGALLTMVGVTVGLGNVWRFPYMMGRHGGSAFLLVYLLFTVCLAVPALMGEWSLGRATGKGPLGAFAVAFGPRAGRAVGAFLLVGLLVANSYYLVVFAQVVTTTFLSVTRGFSAESLPALEGALGAGGLQVGIALALLGAALAVLHRGVRRGIERASKLMVPVAGATMLLLVFHALSREGALGRFATFLRPDFSRLGVEPVFAALGQAAFSVGLGGTVMLVYGSYLRPQQNLRRDALATGLGDAGAALLASLFLVPTILTFNLDMTSGPPLLFSTLPQLFQVMPGGRLVGSLFLAALSLMTFLSTLGPLEVLVSGLGEGLRARRSTCIVLVGAAEAGLILPTALDPSLIGPLDLIFGSGMMTLGSALAVLAVTRGLGRTVLVEQLSLLPGSPAARITTHWLSWIVPGALLLILALYIRSIA